MSESSALKIHPAEGGPPLEIPAHGMVIGRGRDSDLTIDDDQTSRHHATIVHDGNRLLIEDLGSTNGTLVNGMRIAGRRPLAPDDRITIGSRDFVVSGPKLPSVVGYAAASVGAMGTEIAATIPKPSQWQDWWGRANRVDRGIGIALAATVIGVLLWALVIPVFVSSPPADPTADRVPDTAPPPGAPVHRPYTQERPRWTTNASPPPSRRQLPRAATGIRVIARPPGVAIYLDGEHRAFTEPDRDDPFQAATVLITPLPPGDHTVSLRYADKRSEPTRVTVAAGEVADLSLELWLPNCIIDLADGRVLLGMLKAADDRQLVLATEPGHPVIVPRAEVVRQRAITPLAVRRDRGIRTVKRAGKPDELIVDPFPDDD